MGTEPANPSDEAQIQPQETYESCNISLCADLTPDYIHQITALQYNYLTKCILWTQGRGRLVVSQINVRYRYISMAY